MMRKEQQLKYELSFFDEAEEDYQRLDGSQLVFVDKGLNRIRAKGMKAGAPCHGNLEGCNKLKNRKMGLRIVFRQDKGKINIISIVAIGYRRRSKVYKEAFNRINKKR